jgi:DNA replication protein DnaC
MNRTLPLKPLLERLAPTLPPRPATAPPRPEPTCAICDDSGLYTGWVFDDAGGRSLYGNMPCPSLVCEHGNRTRAERDRARLDEILGTANIPPHFADARLDDVDQPASIRDVALRAIATGKSLYLQGGAGGGKTFLSIALLRDQLARGRAGRFVVVPDLLDRIRQGYGEKAGAADAILEAVEAVDLLVLDDLGTERDNDFALEKLYQIVNSRYLHERQTLITTNCTPKELAERIGMRILSRIGEMCVPLTFTGPDRRLGRWR